MSRIFDLFCFNIKKKNHRNKREKKVTKRKKRELKICIITSEMRQIISCSASLLPKQLRGPMPNGT